MFGNLIAILGMGFLLGGAWWDVRRLFRKKDDPQEQPAAPPESGAAPQPPFPPRLDGVAGAPADLRQPPPETAPFDAPGALDASGPFDAPGAFDPPDEATAPARPATQELAAALSAAPADQGATPAAQDEGRLKTRRRRVQESLAENEALTAELDDQTAQRLLAWSSQAAEQIVRETAEMDDESAEQAMAPRLKAVRRVMRSVNRLAAQQAELDDKGRQELIDEIAAQAAEADAREAVSIQEVVQQLRRSKDTPEAQ